MKQMEQLTAKWNKLRRKARPYLGKARSVWQQVKKYWLLAWPWIWRLRKVLFAIPVVYLALYFARLNWNVLPELVGLNLQVNG